MSEKDEAKPKDDGFADIFSSFAVDYPHTSLTDSDEGEFVLNDFYRSKTIPF